MSQLATCSCFTPLTGISNRFIFVPINSSHEAVDNKSFGVCGNYVTRYWVLTILFPHEKGIARISLGKPSAALAVYGVEHFRVLSLPRLSPDTVEIS